MTGIPKSLQSILWSRDINGLDFEKDKVYIINQILSLGTMEQLSWLFRVYPKSEIKRVFLEKPTKIYSPSAFNWITKIVFDNLGINLSPSAYVNNLPRNI